MRVLVLTQAVDTDDLYLGFFHSWLAAFSKTFDHVRVVCLKQGRHQLPANIVIHSLGKESGASRVRYVFRFYAYIWKHRGEYDAVLVHMNQEYVLLGGPLWMLLGKPTYLWRNHYAGGLLTDISALFCTKIFCTSQFSYTAKFKKTVLMPVGVDIDAFRPLPDVSRTPRSILFFGRFAPSKHPDVFIEALGLLKDRSVDFNATICGSPLPKDATYYESVRKRASELGLSTAKFQAGVPNSEAAKIFNAHEIYVNLGGSGMYDKTMFEAAACGCIVLARSADFAERAGKDYAVGLAAGDIAEKIETLLEQGSEEREKAVGVFRSLANMNSLEALTHRLRTEMEL